MRVQFPHLAPNIMIKNEPTPDTRWKVELIESIGGMLEQYKKTTWYTDSFVDCRYVIDWNITHSFPIIKITIEPFNV